MQISNNSKKLLGSFSILLSGSFAAGLLNLIFYPLFSRLYTKEDFGILTALTSVVSFLCIFSTGKYEQAVIIAKDKKEALGLLAIAFSLCASFCTITLLLFLTGFSKIVSWLFHSDTVGTFLWLCPFAVIGISVYNCYNEWSVRGKKYVALSCNRFYNSSLITGCKVALFFLPGGLVFGDTLGRFLSGIQSFFHFFIVEKKHGLNLPSFRETKELLNHYSHFPKFILADQTINYFAGNLPVYFISNFYNMETLGSFSMASSILAIPSAFLEKAFTDIFRSRATDEYSRTKQCRNTYRLFLLIFVIPAFILSAVAILLIPYLFTWFLGSQWKEAGQIAQILFPGIVLRFFFMTFSPVWIITQQLKYRLFWQIGFVILNLIALVLGCVVFNDLKKTFLFLSCSWIISYLLGILNTWKLSRS